MKAHKISTLVAFTLMMGFVHAEHPSADDILNSLDAESEYMEEFAFDTHSTERVNFSMAPTHKGESSEVLDTHDFWDNPGLLGSYD